MGGRGEKGKGEKGKGEKGEKGKGKKGKPDASAVPCKFFNTPTGCTNRWCPFLHDLPSSAASASKPPNGSAQKPPSKGGAAAAGPDAPCKFFGSAKGCSSDNCPFSHEQPNSVPPCSFKQKTGNCDKGDACTFRHMPWASAAQARQFYASRGKGAVELSQKQYKALHRDSGDPVSTKLKAEHVEMELIVEQEMHEETYGHAAMRMMEKMGYKAGAGLGREEQGNTKLVAPCVALEKASQALILGQGTYCVDARATAAERAARLADARAQKRPRLEETAFVQHNLLSDDDSSEGEDKLAKTRDRQLQL